MGMFDSVFIKCPACNGLNELQSKIGECELKRYGQHSVPVMVACDVAEGGPYACKKCEAMLTVRTMLPERVELFVTANPLSGYD